MVHPYNDYSATKMNDVLTQATTWIRKKKIMPSKRSLTQRAMYCMILFICNSQNRQIHGAESRLVDARGWEQEGVEK